jgi:hypothetical protein
MQTPICQSNNARARCPVEPRYASVPGLCVFRRLEALGGRGMEVALVYTEINRRIPDHKEVDMIGFILAAILVIAAIIFFIKAAFTIGVVLLIGAIVAALFGPLSRTHRRA